MALCAASCPTAPWPPPWPRAADDPASRARGRRATGWLSPSPAAPTRSPCVCLLAELSRRAGWRLVGADPRQPRAAGRGVRRRRSLLLRAGRPPRPAVDVDRASTSRGTRPRDTAVARGRRARPALSRRSTRPRAGSARTCVATGHTAGRSGRDGAAAPVARCRRARRRRRSARGAGRSCGRCSTAGGPTCAPTWRQRGSRFVKTARTPTSPSRAIACGTRRDAGD